MPVYSVQGPDGKIYDIEGPAGATADQLGHFIQQNAHRVSSPPIDPTEGMSGLDKFLAGTGKGFVDLARGTGQLIREGAEAVSPSGKSFSDSLGLPTRQDIDESKRLDAPLMNTGAGIAGNIVGNIAAAVPAMAIPGANTIVGGGLIGSATGALQPVGESGSRTDNMLIGGIAGAAVPAVIRASKVIKAAAIDPFTEAGKQRIVGSALNNAASNAPSVIQTLKNAKGATPGFNPTAGQAADDAGIASVERAARAIDPAGFGAVDNEQRSALVNALRSVAGTPEARAAAVEARDSAANTLYGKAFDLDQVRQAANRSTAMNYAAGIHQAADSFTPPISSELRALTSRPIFQQAVEQAKTLAKNQGVDIGDPLKSLQGLHLVKLAMDDMLSAPVQGANALGRNAQSAVNSARSSLISEIDKLSPSYGMARETFSKMSQPINQMDIGQELYNRFVPALADNSAVPFKARADALANALRNGDDLARNVTGLKGVTLNKVMTPEQIGTLSGVVKDAQMKAAAETAGRGVGSDTVQKMAMSHLISQAGLPSWIQSIGRLPGGWMRTAGDVLFSKNDETLRHLMAETLKDPQATAAAMERAGVQPSKIAQYLKLTAQSAGIGLPSSAANMGQ